MPATKATGPSDEEIEFRADRAVDAIFSMWDDCRTQQYESAVIFNRLVTHDDPRIPNADEVRGFLHGLVHGSLVWKPKPPKSKLQRAWDFLTKWDDE